MDKKRRNKISFVTTLFGLIANALLCAGKFAVGLLCGNIAVTADAVNNLSALIFWGRRCAERTETLPS